MSFDNHYPNRKDHRRPYYDSKRIDRTCRNHGSCKWCEGNRTISSRRIDVRAKEEEKQVFKDYDQDSS